MTRETGNEMGAIVSPAMARAARAAAVHDSLAARLLSWIRRLTGARADASPAPLHAEARLSLGPKKSLVLVNCCGRRVLVGLAGDNLVPLGEWPEPRRGAARNGRARDGRTRSGQAGNEAAL